MNYDDVHNHINGAKLIIIILLSAITVLLHCCRALCVCHFQRVLLFGWHLQNKLEWSNKQPKGANRYTLFTFFPMLNADKEEEVQLYVAYHQY